jgi:phage terminase small subunit
MPVRRTTRNENGLSDIEEAFVREYLVDLCQANAMRRADGGEVKKAWRQLGHQMMQRPHVRAAVEKAMQERAKRLDTTADEVLREIARLAMFDPAELTGVTCPEDIALLPELVRRAIVGWSWDRQGRFTIKLAKETALGMLAQHHGLLKQQIEHSGGVTITATPLDQAL